MDNKIAITAIILMLAGFTYIMIAGLEPTHYCLNKEIKAYCYNLSSTERTCYTLPAKTGGKLCDETWKEIPFIGILDQFQVQVSQEGNRLHCTSLGCK